MFKKKNQPSESQEPPSAGQRGVTGSRGYEKKYDLIEVKVLRGLEAQAAEVTQIRERAALLKTEFEQSRTRLERDKEEAVKFANASLLESLLPIIDNFELGLTAASQSSESNSIIQGMKMVKTQLERFLADHGVEEINALGQPFDPNIHEAVSQKETDEAEEGTVIEQKRKGYRHHGRLLRPASVVVARTAHPSS